MDKLVYIHGVSPRGVTSHRNDYQAFHNGVSAELGRLGRGGLPAFGSAALVEWGTTNSKAGVTAKLAKAQAVIADRVDKATPPDRTSFGHLVFAPAIEPVRKLVGEAWADLTYYVSEKGKIEVRSVVWQRILERVGPENPADLTVIGHSAGSLIAIDFLFWLFSNKRDTEELSEFGIDPADASAAAANWRVRRIVTFGSPIAALMVRSPEVAAILAGNGTLDARSLGLGRKAHDGSTPVWLNLWDRHDVLSFPVAPFYTGANVVDLYPDHSDSLLGSHEGYWRSSSVHRQVAERW
ncbi:MAG: hypothetical protein OEX04_13855 [Acidimicrobiia bacterium]|nr:hypothetical protein [Acidimicrobiia bacterium]MDH4308555.1 hypothetical protein [Acidimicrobiia bacterium]